MERPPNSNLYGWWTFDSANSVWKSTGEEVEQDRLYIMWPITDVAGREGLTFAQAGCKAFCHRINGSNIAATPQPIGDCGACHENTSGTPKAESFEHITGCSNCHAPTNTEADMAAPAGGALDIWHWKAQDSYIGFATDQSALSGTKRANDGSPTLDPNNSNASGTAPKYIWPLNADNSASTGDFNDFLLKSVIGKSQVVELADDGLTIKNSAIPVPNGTTVRKKILNDVDATETIKNILAQQSYSVGTYRVVLKRALDSPDDKDYDFKLDDNNYFSVAVTDNSEIKHAGSAGPYTLLLDSKSPTAHVSSPGASKTTQFEVSWSGSDPSPSSGIVGYDVQVKTGPNGSWTWWQTNTVALSSYFEGGTGKSYDFRARARDSAGNIGAWSETQTTIVNQVGRLWGMTSTDTAIAICKMGFPNGSKVALVARDDYFTDALAGGPLAKYVIYKYGSPAPILLTNSNYLTNETRAEIQKLGAEKVYLLGGPGAVSETVKNDLGAISGIKEVIRLWGQSAYGTAQAIKDEMDSISNEVSGSPKPDTAIITTGENFPDSLVISGPAASKNMPILLVKPFKDEPQQETIEALHGIKNVIIVGGPGAVHPNLENWLRTNGYDVLTRLWGNTEYDTAIDVASSGNSIFNFNMSTTLVTRGDYFTDALSGGAYASMGPYPMALVLPDSIPPITNLWLTGNKDQINTVYILGGWGAVSDGVMGQVEEMIIR